MAADGGIRAGIGRWAASLGFYLYALLAAPWLARGLKAGMEGTDPVWWPGVVVLTVLALEPFGLRGKLRFLRRRNQEEGFQPKGPALAVFSATGIAHVLVTMFCGMLVLDAWGLVGGSENASGWGLALMVALVLKEFVGLFAAGGQSVSREPPGHWKEPVADLFLLAYGCVAYTAWWQAIVDLEAVGEGPLGPRLALMPVLVPLFLFFYLPMRLPFLLEEYHLRPARGRRGRLAAELGMGAVLGLYPVFFG